MTDEVDKAVVVFTDGSATVKGTKQGGWAFVAQYKSAITYRFGYKKGATISEMELEGVIRPLQMLKLTHVPVIIYSDSQYVVNTVNGWFDMWKANGWVNSTGGTPAHLGKINYLMRLIRLHRQHRKVTIEWVKGHAGHKGNDLADTLAGRGRRCRETNWVPDTDHRNRPTQEQDEE